MQDGAAPNVNQTTRLRFNERRCIDAPYLRHFQLRRQGILSNNLRDALHPSHVGRQRNINHVRYDIGQLSLPYV